MWGLLLAAAAAAAGLSGDVWPAFRGDGTSNASAQNLPLEWSDQRGVAWRIQLEGYGQSSPIVWDGQIYVTSVEGPNKETLVTAAYRLEDGERLWIDRRPSSRPAEAHERMAKAAPTPVSDANGVYVFFESGDLIALDHEGKELWARFLPREGEDWAGNHGLGSSPVLSNGRLYLHAAPVGPGRLFALDAQTGDDLWTHDLPPAPSFSTPLLVRHDGRELLLTTAGGGVVAYDADGGEEVFRRPARGGRGYAVPSASHANGIVVVASGEAGGTHAFSLRAPAETLWTSEKATTEFSSPLIHDGEVYLVNSVGVLFELDLATGAQRSVRRLPAGCWASPIVAEDRLYFFSLDGSATVFEPGRREPITESSLGAEQRIYGIASVNESILVRAGSTLWRLARSG